MGLLYNWKLGCKITLQKMQQEAIKRDKKGEESP